MRFRDANRTSSARRPGAGLRASLLVLFSGLVLLGFSGSSASAAGTGSITGTVTDNSGGPLQYVCVKAYNAGGEEVKISSTNWRGEYKIADLDPGDYRIEFLRCDNVTKLSEFYDNVGSLAEATPVSVTSGANAEGIDAVLATGGTISGTVTDAGGNPLGGACARAYDVDGNQVGSDQTDLNGQYAIVGLSTGEYRVQFRGCGKNAAPEFYDDQETLTAAAPVQVTAGTDTGDIDAQLALGGSISGTISNDALGPLEKICVDAFDSTGERVAHDRSDPEGKYRVVGLGSGEHRLRFYQCASNLNLLEEYYGDEATLEEATPVNVDVGSETTGIDAELATGGIISGTLAAADNGAPSGSVCLFSVTVYDSAGEPARSRSFLDSGSYRIDRLPTGEYRVGFHFSCAQPTAEYIWTPVGTPMFEFYEDKQTLEEATPVQVTAGQETTKIHGHLGQNFPTGSLSGTVTDENGDPLDGVCVKLFNSNGTLKSGRSANSDGTYRFGGLATGQYRLEFRGCGDWGPNVLGEFYENAPNLETATPVSVTDDVDTTGIDAQLAPGGTISGTVTDNSGTPLPGICVQAYDDEGNLEDADGTDSSGNYTIVGLGSGQHRVKFNHHGGCSDVDSPNGFQPEFYEDVTTLEAATPIAVTAGSDTPGIDAELAAPPTTDPDPDVPNRAKISKLTVRGPAKVRIGRKAVYRVRITNSGNQPVKGARLQVKGRGGLPTTLRNITIPPATTRAVKVKVKPKRRGTTVLSFKVTTSNAGSRAAKRRIIVTK